MPKTVLTVFLSSTGLDLDAYRQELHRQITGCDLLKCVRMEDFGPQDADAVDYCQKAARDADIFIGIIGLRRGWEPKGDNKQRSITEMEHDASEQYGRPRFIAISPADFPVPGNLRETDDVHARQLGFRSRIGERVAGVHNFESPATLASEFVTKLLSHIISSDLIKHVRPDLASPQGAGVEVREEQAPAIAAAFEKLAEDENIDLLAMARDPQGIDISDLERKLIAQAEQHASNSIAERRKAAEYWRHVGALAFLNDTRKALHAYRTATELYPSEAGGWNELGKLLWRVGELDQADDSYRKSLEIYNALDQKQGMAGVYVNLSALYLTRGDLDLAEDVLRKASALDEELGDQEGLASDYGNLGTVYLTRGDLDQAEEMYLKSLALEEALGRQEGMANAYGNVGIVYKLRGDLNKAEEMYLKSLALEEALGRQHGIACDYGNLGVIYLTRGKFEQAEEMFGRSLALEEALNHKEGMANQYSNLGSLCLQQKKFEQAEIFYLQGLAINEALGRKEGMANTYANLGIVFKQTGDIIQAIRCWQKAYDLYAAVGVPRQKEKMEKWITDASGS